MGDNGGNSIKISILLCSKSEKGTGVWIMSVDRVCKTIHQYNKEPIKEADMQKLLEIAGDYRKVKNYVYSRYGGIASLSKIYPGYTVQNEMTDSGYREILGMPSVYFYLAVFEYDGHARVLW